jgi:parvulin-like peptidyl-prolyl isomerase
MQAVRTPRIMRGALLALAAAALHAPIALAAKPSIESADAGDVVATVNGVAVHRAELDEAMIGRQESMRPQVLQGLVARELLRQAAERDGLGNTEPVRAAMRKARIDTENRLYIARHVSTEPVTDTDVRRRYDEIAGQFGPYQYQVSRMTFSDEPTARFALALLGSGESFANVAARTHATDVQTDWISFKTPPAEGRTQGLPLPLAQTIAAMNAGDITRTPIRAGDRFIVARLDDRRDAVVPSFAQASGAMSNALERKRADDAFAALIAQLAQKAAIRPAQLMKDGSK